MQYGVNLPITVDAHTLAWLAAEAEAAGWDGAFVWDCLSGSAEHEPEKQAIYDPFGPERHLCLWARPAWHLEVIQALVDGKIAATGSAGKFDTHLL
jgi:hypothetical protein